jgi:hypothetical protein
MNLAHAGEATAPHCRVPLTQLGVHNRGPLSGKGIYEMIRRCGKDAGVHVYPHRFRHHSSHT